MTLDTATKLTIIVMVTAVACVAAYDVWVYAKYGSDATISRILYNAAKDSPIFAVLFGLGIGTILGHLFWSQKIETKRQISVIRKEEEE